jgi:hypothetical protein
MLTRKVFKCNECGFRYDHAVAWCTGKIGRVTRPCPGKVEACIIDQLGNVMRYSNESSG